MRLLLLALAAAAPATVPLGANLERFDYGAPVYWFEAGAGVRMAYLDLAPATQANGTTVVLLHGKNFCAGTWLDTARALAAGGYRVIAPDQVGFCKSSKPANFQYSVPSLASLTRGLLDSAGVGRVVLVGHSTGGLIATRFALLYPDRVRSLVLVNPLGLNDTIADGAPYATLDQLRAEEEKTDAETIRAYQLKNYYHGQWRPDFDRWVAMLAGQYASADGASVREAQARTSEMIEAGPVAAELPRLTVPTTLIIGEADRTAFRGDSAPSGVHVRTVPEAAEAASRAIPHARLVRLDGLGHAPMVEAPGRLQTALLRALQAAPDGDAAPQTNVGRRGADQ